MFALFLSTSYWKCIIDEDVFLDTFQSGQWAPADIETFQTHCNLIFFSLETPGFEALLYCQKGEKFTYGNL